MKPLRTYFEKRFSVQERARIHMAITAARAIHFVTKGEVEITIRNRHNPNGLYVKIDQKGAQQVDRSINLKWAKAHGYEVR